MNTDSIFECIGFYGILRPQVKPQINTPYTIRCFIKKNTVLGITRDRTSMILVNEDCVYLNELKNVQYEGVEVPYCFRNFSQIEFPDPEAIEELLKEPQLV